MTRRKHADRFEVNGAIQRRTHELLDGNRELQRCSKCLMTETESTLTFDENGVCNICQNAEERDNEIDWKAREKEFVEIIEQYRGKHTYDAILPFGGGKDSSYVAYMAVRKFNLKVLLVTFDQNFRRKVHLENLDRVVRGLGCDHVTVKANEDIIRSTMLESLKRKGDFCWFCHTGVVAAPFKAALNHDVPLIIWGEPSSEYVGGYYGYKEKNPADERWFNRTINLSINAEDMMGYLDEEVDPRDFEVFRLPDQEKIQAADIRSIHLGDYFRWDALKQIKILNEELGWEPTETENLHPRYFGEKIDCFLQGSRDYLRYIKRGYSRTNQRANLEIRFGHITREDALEMEQYDAQRPQSLDVVLDYLGISEDEFNNIAENHMIYPHVHDPSKIRHSQFKLADHDPYADRLGRIGEAKPMKNGKVTNSTGHK
jgi:N-acetyl sugar amidotransferase